MPRKLIIVGASGWGLEAHWVATAMRAAGSAEWNVAGFIDDGKALPGALHAGLPVLGGTKDISSYLDEDSAVFIAVGDNKVRVDLAERLALHGCAFATLIHPRAEIAADAEVGAGTYIGAFATLAPQCRVGDHVIINIGAVIGHETVVADFGQVAPGAILTGGCRTGRGAFIGSNASVHPGCQVGASGSVASNSFVMSNVEPRQTALGIPARPVFQR